MRKWIRSSPRGGRCAAASRLRTPAKTLGPQALLPRLTTARSPARLSVRVVQHGEQIPGKMAPAGRSQIRGFFATSRDGGVRTRGLLLPNQPHLAARRGLTSPGVAVTWDNADLTAPDVARCLRTLTPMICSRRMRQGTGQGIPRSFTASGFQSAGSSSSGRGP
jgi:hypothetical protein